MIRRALAWLTAALAVTAAAPVGTQVASWPSERPPEPLAVREVPFPDYDIRTLANGLRVVAVPHHEQPAVSLRLLIGAGTAHDPIDKPGVANLMALVLDQGTTTRSAQEIAIAIDNLGGALGVAAGTDVTFVNAIVLKEDLGFALGLVADVARHPAFAPEEIERQRQQVLSGLRVTYDDPEYVAGMVFDRLVYGSHPYGRPSNGTPGSIPAITRGDLVSFHEKYFLPNHAILAIVGDVTTSEAFAKAESVFGDWSHRESRLPDLGDPPPPVRRVVVVDRPGAVQTEIRVGHLGVARNNPDYLALELAIKILGGEGANRLHRVLRSERGLTYGASAEFETLRQSGDFVVKTSTRPETTAEALRLIVDEYWRIRNRQVNRSELGSAQAFLAGSYPLTIETPSAIALHVLDHVFYDLDLDDLQTFPQRVHAVTPTLIQEVAECYLTPDRLSIVLVGDADRFAGQLRGAGFGEYERVALSELDLDALDRARVVRANAASLDPDKPPGVRIPSSAPMRRRSPS